MQVISSIGGMSRARSKQWSYDGTAGSGTDIWVGQPPVVAVTEKASLAELYIALGGVRTKVGTLDEILPIAGCVFSELKFLHTFTVCFHPSLREHQVCYWH